LDAGNNLLITLKASLPSLEYLYVQDNQLATLNVSNLATLDYRGDKGTRIIEDDAIVINVYPNPTVDKVYLSANADVKLYTLQGVLLYSGYGNEVDLTDYPKGVYILQVNGQTAVKVMKL